MKRREFVKVGATIAAAAALAPYIGKAVDEMVDLTEPQTVDVVASFSGIDGYVSKITPTSVTVSFEPPITLDEGMSLTFEPPYSGCKLGDRVRVNLS